MNAICFLCDALEYGGMDLFNIAAPKAAEKFIEAMQVFKEDRGIIQSAGYGLGVIAKRTPQGTFTLVQQSV